jgi:hypothetical protein
MPCVMVVNIEKQHQSHTVSHVTITSTMIGSIGKCVRASQCTWRRALKLANTDDWQVRHKCSVHHAACGAMYM